MTELPVNLLRPSPILPQSGPPRRRLARFLALVLIFLLLLNWIINKFTIAKWPAEPAAYDTVTLQPKRQGFFQTVKNFFFHANNVLEGQASDRVNILILGIGGVGHDGPFLSDTNIIASIKPSTKEVALISVPRDLGAKIDGHGWRKINSADAFGEAESPGLGGDYARQIVAETFNLSIPYYIRVDFSAFEKIINTVGGVNVNIPRGFTDIQFPGPNYSYQTISFTAGQQTLNGQQALNYVRSRHGTNGEDSDFARSRRQQLVLTALKQELLSAGTLLNPIRIKQIIDSLSSHVVTNLDFGQLMFLAGLAKDAGGQIKTLVLDSSPNGFLINTTGDNGAFILSPKNGSFDEINSAITDVFSNQIASTTATQKLSEPGQAQNKIQLTSGAKIHIQNGTWRAGLASRFKDKLIGQNFSVIDVGNSFKRPIDSSAIYLLNQSADQKTIAALQNLFHVSATGSLPDWLAPGYDNPATIDNEQGMKYNSAADILVILGNDTKE